MHRLINTTTNTMQLARLYDEGLYKNKIVYRMKRVRVNHNNIIPPAGTKCMCTYRNLIQ